MREYGQDQLNKAVRESKNLVLSFVWISKTEKKNGNQFSNLKVQ